jgi:ATPase family associated with various cellular activities (AAA)
MDTIRAAIERATSLQLRIRDCNSLLQHAEAYANKRWLRKSSLFKDLESDFRIENPHMVNTSTAMAILCCYPDVFRRGNILAFSGLSLEELCKFYMDNYQRPKEQEEGRPYWPSKDTKRWSPYVSSLVLTAIAECALAEGAGKLHTILEKEDFKDLAEAISTQARELVSYLKQWAGHLLPKEDADYDHTFFAYTAWTAVESLSSTGYPVVDTAQQRNFEKDLFTRFKLEFYSQMTFKLANIPQHLDPTNLILSMYCLRPPDARRFPLKSTTGAETLIAQLRDREQLAGDVLDAAFETVFSLQQTTGFWPTATPLLGTATGRVGCSSVELANCLLKIPRLALHFDKYQHFFDRLFSQLFKEFDIYEPERGWSVDIRRNGNARQTWYGFMVYEFVHLYAKRMSETAAMLILRGFRYTRDTPKVTWELLADYDGLKAQIESTVIRPRLEKSAGTTPKCSVIFFGPPGTGKTTIATALAHKLGWGMIEIGPGDFLTNGIEGIFAQGDMIFERLLMLDHVVVLFDEIDELVQARDSESDKISRFLTTYMLPWVQRLRDKAAIVFIFATNRIKVFDPAIRRIGRFDLVLPLGPPQGEERIKVMRTMKLGMAEVDLQNLAGKLPPQTTIGEIQDAVEKVRRTGAITVEAIMKRLKTATSDPDWQNFLEESVLHGSGKLGD